jgi:hypothetical protein
MIPNLIFDIDLDLAWNALACNTDLRWTLEQIRRREIELSLMGSVSAGAESGTRRQTRPARGGGAFHSRRV